MEMLLSKKSFMFFCCFKGVFRWLLIDALHPLLPQHVFAQIVTHIEGPLPLQAMQHQCSHITL